ncbi:MAG: MMPL family transporter [Thermoanaerobaculia bacterium]
MLIKIFKKERRIFWLSLTLCLLPFAIIGITKLSLETDAFKLMPEGDKTFESFKKSVKLFGGLDNIIIFFEIPDKENLENYLSFVDELCEDLKKVEEGIGISCYPPDPKPYFEFFLKNLVVLSSNEEFNQVLSIFDKKKMEEILKETKFELSSILDPEVKGFLLLDPLKFHRIYWERFNKPLGSFKIDYLSGYFLSEDHSALLIILKPRGTAQDINYSTDLIYKIEKLLKKKVENWDFEGKVPKIEVGGGFKIAVEDARIIKGDIFWQILTSLILVLFLYYLSFRNFKTLFFPLIPLGFGMIFTFGFAGWFLKELNVSSSAFAALLVGLGIDFVIIIYSRFLEERLKVEDYNEIFYLLEREVYPSIFLGAITTVGTFGVFYLTKLKGLKELGILTSIGIIFVMFFSFTLLPLLLLFEKKIEKRKRTLYKLFLQGVYSTIDFSFKKRKFIIFISIILVFLSIFFIKRIPFQDSAEALRSKGNRGIIIQEEISKIFGRVGYPSIVLIEKDNLKDLIILDEKLKAHLEELKIKNIVYSHQGISDLIPSLEKQKDNLKRVQNVNFEEFYENFASLCIKLDLNIEVFQPFLEDLRFAFKNPRILDWKNLQEFGELIKLNQIAFKEGEKFFSFRTIYFPEGKYKREPPVELEKFVKNYPEMTLTGVNAMAKELRILVRKDAFMATSLGFVLVFLMLFASFRSLKNTLLTLVPLISGISLMLSIMGIFKIPFNSMNIFVMLMVVGIGTDYGIHLIHRFYSSKGDVDSLSHTGSAVLFSALTTIAGFGSLILSHFLGLKSMGYIAILGTFFVLVFTLTLLPAILKKQ